MPEPQNSIAAFNARIAEYVAEMDAAEAEAFRRADCEQAKADATLTEAHSDVPSRI
jgi:hypothetical protein